VTYNSKLDYPNSRQALAIGMRLTLASLGMLFVAGMLLYLLFFLHFFGDVQMVRVHLPRLTWASTLVLIAGSYSIHRAVAAVQLERQAQMRRWLYITSGLALVFLAIQIPCMAKIWSNYAAVVAPAIAQTTGRVRPVPLDGLVFCLIGLHAAHVVGGIIVMAIVTYNAHRGRYDHEQYMAVKHAALYWHFLDVIWLMMFTVFTITG